MSKVEVSRERVETDRAWHVHGEWRRGSCWRFFCCKQTCEAIAFSLFGRGGGIRECSCFAFQRLLEFKPAPWTPHSLCSSSLRINPESAHGCWSTPTPDRRAMTPTQKQGALVFFGKGRCAVCQSGQEFSDFGFHSLAVPQLSVAKHGAFVDYGRANATSRGVDRYKFRTAPLRNVRQTGPWGHNVNRPGFPRHP